MQVPCVRCDASGACRASRAVEMQPRDRPRVLTGEASSWYRAHRRRCDSLEMRDGVSCPGDLDKVAGFGTPCLDDSSRSGWRGEGSR
jgi:hypothetical protein